jgi:hypothetical protein
LQIEEFDANSKRLSDGLIYQRLRSCQEDGDLEGELKWQALLGPSKVKDLSQLRKNGPLFNAYDSLRPIPGLWPPVLLGIFHRILPMKCDEVCGAPN